MDPSPLRQWLNKLDCFIHTAMLLFLSNGIIYLFMMYLLVCSCKALVSFGLTNITMKTANIYKDKNNIPETRTLVIQNTYLPNIFTYHDIPGHFSFFLKLCRRQNIKLSLRAGIRSPKICYQPHDRHCLQLRGVVPCRNFDLNSYLNRFYVSVFVESKIKINADFTLA